MSWKFFVTVLLLIIAGPVGAQVPGEVTNATQPLGDVSLQVFIGRIINTILGLTGVIALVMFIYGGFLYMTAAGNEERITKGKKTLVWATLGIVMVFSAYGIVRFILKGLGQA